MKPSIFLFVVNLHYVFSIVNMIIGVRTPCNSILDCLSSEDPNTVCYQAYCVPCRQSSESCSSAAHCCSGARCYRQRCTPLYKTGQSCRLSRECFDTDDFCVDRICTRCLPLYSSCSTNSLSTPCCIGQGLCRSGVCKPAHTQSRTCTTTFDCADELVCLSGTCQDPLGGCQKTKN